MHALVDRTPVPASRSPPEAAEGRRKSVGVVVLRQQIRANDYTYIYIYIYIHTYTMQTYWQLLKIIGLVTGQPRFCCKPIEVCSTLHTRPATGVCNRGPGTKVCNRGGALRQTPVSSHTHICICIYTYMHLSTYWHALIFQTTRTKRDSHSCLELPQKVCGAFLI